MPKSVVHKEMRELVKEIQTCGFLVLRPNGGHQKVLTADKKFVYSLPTTPGRGRWRQNLVSELRKRGVTLSDR